MSETSNNPPPMTQHEFSPHPHGYPQQQQVYGQMPPAPPPPGFSPYGDPTFATYSPYAQQFNPMMMMSMNGINGMIPMPHMMQMMPPSSHGSPFNNPPIQPHHHNQSPHPPQSSPYVNMATRQKKKFNAKSQAFVPTKNHSEYLKTQSTSSSSSSSSSQSSSTLAPQQPSASSTSTKTSSSTSPMVSAPSTASSNTPALNSITPNGNTNGTNGTNGVINGKADSKADSNGTANGTAHNKTPETIDSSSQSSSTTTISSPSINTPSSSKSVHIPEEPSPVFQAISGSVTLPLLFGSNEESFVNQRSKYNKLRQAKLASIIADKKTSTTTITNGKLETSNTEQPTKPMTGWAAIASQGAKRHSTKSQSSSPITPSSSIKREVSYVPSVSNVLEPLGVITLRYMFDKTFQKQIINTKIPTITPRGLVNTGNICFMSSIIQMLLYCQPFFRALRIISSKTIQSLNREQSISPLFDALVELYSQFTSRAENEKKKDAITPTEFYKDISKNERFSHLQWGQQEDAEEFFGYLLDGLHEEFTESVKRLNELEVKTLLNSTTDDVRNVIKTNLKKYQEGDFNSSETSGRSDSITEDGWQEVGSSNKKTAKRTVEVKPSPVRQIFGGQFRSVLQIPKSKESQSITLDPFQQIQLDISYEDVNTLEDAFTKLSEVEEIPYKSTDGSDVIAKKQTFIDKFPEVLIVHLKRFSFASNKRIEKLRKKITYSHDLTIPNVCITPSIRRLNPESINYKLTAVVYHHGMSSDGGHYTVDVLRSDESKWIRIDDTVITNLTPEEVLNGGVQDDVKSAYILMYQRV